MYLPFFPASIRRADLRGGRENEPAWRLMRNRRLTAVHAYLLRASWQLGFCWKLDDGPLSLHTFSFLFSFTNSSGPISSTTWNLKRGRALVGEIKRPRCRMHVYMFCLLVHVIAGIKCGQTCHMWRKNRSTHIYFCFQIFKKSCLSNHAPNSDPSSPLDSSWRDLSN